jgi:hypothetical protein
MGTDVGPGARGVSAGVSGSPVTVTAGPLRGSLVIPPGGRVVTTFCTFVSYETTYCRVR